VDKQPVTHSPTSGLSVSCGQWWMTGVKRITLLPARMSTHPQSTAPTIPSIYVEPSKAKVTYL